MIYTSNYYNVNNSLKNTISISGDGGKLVNYQGLSYPKLAPKKDFWQIWYKRINNVSINENTIYYINEYYKQVLSKLDAFKTYEELEKNNIILLCYENNDAFCHRHIVAIWFQLLLNKHIDEIMIKNDEIIVLPRPNNIDFLTDILKTAIIEDENINNNIKKRILTKN